MLYRLCTVSTTYATERHSLNSVKYRGVQIFNNYGPLSMCNSVNTSVDRTTVAVSRIDPEFTVEEIISSIWQNPKLRCAPVQ